MGEGKKERYERYGGESEREVGYLK